MSPLKDTFSDVLMPVTELPSGCCFHSPNQQTYYESCFYGLPLVPRRLRHFAMVGTDKSYRNSSCSSLWAGFLSSVQRTLVITTLFGTKDLAVKTNLLL